MCDLSDFTPDQARQLLEIWKTRLFQLEQKRARSGSSTEPEVLTEIEAIRDKEIPSLLTQLKDVTGEYIGDQARDKMDHIHQRVEQLTSEYSGITFINREGELREIIHPLARPFILVEAPARYGKTFLLERAKAELEKTGWLVCLVDLTNLRATEDEMEFLRLVYDSLPDQSIDKSLPLPSDVERALSSLIGRVSCQGRPVVLLLDGAERIRKAEFVGWMRDQFIYQLEQKVRETVGGKFRCIVAGRYIAQAWRDQRSKYSLANECFGDPIRLSPFTFRVVLETVDSLARKSGRQLLRAAMEQVARGVRTISGGHPECLVSLLLEVDIEHGLNPLPSYFDDLEGLFTRHIESACRAILRDVPDPIIDIFPFLCQFRCYNEAIVKTVVDWADKKGQLGDKAEHDAGRVLQLLTQQGFLVWDPKRRFYVDDVVRRVITLQQRLRCKDLEDLNQIALKRYDEWLDKPPLLDPVRYQAMIVEHLYHFSVHLNQVPTDPDKAAQEFREKLRQDYGRFESCFRESLGPFEWRESLSALLYSLHGDEDIQAEMARAARGCSSDNLLEPLRQVI